MNGKQATQIFLDFANLAQLDDNYASQRRIFECMDMAACIYVRQTRCCHAQCEIKTGNGQQLYELPPDFIDLYILNNAARPVVKYYDGSTTSYPYFTDYERIFLNNQTETQSRPLCFTIIQSTENISSATGTASDDGTEEENRSTLVDDAKDFLGADRVYPRDYIINTTSGASGIIMDVQETTLGCFVSGGTRTTFEEADDYKILPAPRQAIYLDAPSLDDDHIITVPYVCLPPPMYSGYATWPFPERTCRAIISGAVSLLKMGSMEYVESKSLGALFDAEVSLFKTELARKKLQQGPSRRRERL